MKKSPVLDNEFLKKLGIIDWGYTEDPLPRSFNYFQEWVYKSHHEPLKYLSGDRLNLRQDLRHVFPEFQSALVFLFSYQTTKKWMLQNKHHEVAGYSLGFEGEDYHRALNKRLEQIVSTLNLTNLKTFFSLDAQPVLERDLAYRAGLGWFGKNSMLIHQKEGSYFIIGSILLNQKLPIISSPVDVDHCGQCSACIDQCPTNAIDPDTRTLLADKCISTYTIEVFKETPPPEGFEKSRGEIFGCDICQDVCPWNKKPLNRVNGDIYLEVKFSFLKEWFYTWPKEKLLNLILKETNRGLKRKLLGTPFDRPGRIGWIKNLKANSNRSDFSEKHKDEVLQKKVHDEEDA